MWKVVADEKKTWFLTSAAPYWESGKPQDVDVAEDDTVDLNCFAAADPAPVTHWLRNGKILKSLFTTSRSE